MKTKEDDLKLSGLLELIKVNFQPKDYEVFNFLFIRNAFKLKKTLEERDEVVKFLQGKFEGEPDQFEKFVVESEEFKSFLTEESDIEYYKIKIDTLENKEYNLQVAESLLGLLIIE